VTLSAPEREHGEGKAALPRLPVASAAVAAETEEDVVRVSTLELFFDLVFVFTITQLTALLAHETTWRGALQVVLMLGVIWWMYGGYVWLTNAVQADRVERRMLLLGGMGAFLIVALAVPRAFDEGGPAFGIAYFLVVFVHLFLFAKTSNAATLRAVLRLARYNVSTAALVLIGGIAGGTAQYVLWALAVVLEWLTPLFIASRFTIAPGHFVERHGLVILIAIGESIIAVGVGAAEAPLDLELAAVALCGLAFSASLWWAYFGGGDDARAEEALAATPRDRRPRLAIYAFGYWHLLMLLGIVGIAAAEKKVVAHPFEALATAQAVTLGVAAGVFMLGDVLFRRSLSIGHGRGRAVAVVLAAATIPLGLAAAALQLAALVALLVAALASEQRAPRLSRAP
jgi:low temperature requirement protein LtrA